MKQQNRAFFGGSGLQGRILQLVNLRPEEGERTLLMFAFYTMTTIGLLWLEHSAVALFLKKYGAEWLPVIYIASALIGSGAGFLYTWLARIVPLRSLLVAISALMGLPLFLFRLGLDSELIGILPLVTIFLLRLWMDAIDVLNDLNTSISANQLFNIREIKRTYPLISSGMLVADVISGFSLPLLVLWVGLPNVIVVAGVMMLLGAGILYILCQRYQQSFPQLAARQIEETESEYTARRRLQGPMSRYVIPLFAFFILGQILFLLIEFQYLGQLERKLDTTAIASFLGLFSGVIGLFELITQWFISSRAIERLGVFVAAMILPASITILGLFTFAGAVSFFWGLIALKFIDELVRYTILASIGPVFFQPLPENARNSLQAVVRGIAQTLSTGATGLGILAMIGLVNWIFPNMAKEDIFALQSHIFIFCIVVFALIWLGSVWLLRSTYVGLLVQSAQSSRLTYSDVDLRALKRAVVEVLEQPGTEADKRSCIQLVCQIDPENVGEALAPLLGELSPALQRQSLEAMLEAIEMKIQRVGEVITADATAKSWESDLNYVQALIVRKPPPEVLALALRYVWLTAPEPEIGTLLPYLHERVDPIVRSTAAALILRRGNPTEKAEATNTLRRMLTSQRERERVMGCRALGEAAYLQALRLYIPNLLQDESLRVRCALLEVIASTHLEEYYPSLLRGLHYKSTREAARGALVRLGDEAIPLLLELAGDIHTPDTVHLQALSALGEIGTKEALDRLAAMLMTSWGTMRRNILRILLKMPQEAGIEGVLDRFGRSGIETLIEQELLFVGQVYAAIVDLGERVGELGTPSSEVVLLLRSLKDLQSDVRERCFLLMKFLYPESSIQAAAFNLESDSRSNVALGLEILDNTLDIPRKRVLLGVLDKRSEVEKLQSLVEMVPYRPMQPSDRLRRLLELRHFLSDWPLACCFHAARAAKWSLTPEQTLVCLRHPTGFVREAVLAYLKAASPRTLAEMLPALKNDPDRLVAAQVEQMMAELK
ncbi:MFS transporter [Microcoleus sp. FACHB-831]|uniref:Npt1/Npt2 family nucleotide transporter n=1 Tax=Microcoleus sp. FACHB-831 TaxID=2692827 RepID=UPI0016862B40|nr:Npt1/Npt2 family nucleotide transporter [Microcoleus sp. FACHB-831]MBD1923231.1 MFS transporter [Microcoleus sp. FACHB-831]